jgi:hypothetical protein
MAQHGTNDDSRLYYKLFNTLPSLNNTIADLELLASIMQKKGPPKPDPRPPQIIPDPLTIGSVNPAIHTYFGQFVDHDITFETRSILGQSQTNIDTLLNNRTSWFDLDCVYGLNNEFLTLENNTKFEIAFNANGDEDMPRNPTTGQALIADIRNNENIITQNIQLAFFKFHNKCFDELKANNANANDAELITQVKSIARGHYQYLLINEFLSKLLLPSEFNRFFGNVPFDITTSAIYTNTPKLPIEISGAAYRLHSLIRNEYQLNDLEKRQIFSLKKPDLRGMKPLEPGLAIKWNLWFPTQGFNGFQVTGKLDPHMVGNLFQLPLDNNDSLSRRNLVRGHVYGLPSGQDVAKFFNYPVLTNSSVDPATKLTIKLEDNFAAENALDPVGIPQTTLDTLNTVFGDATPLWYYIMAEAEIVGNGNTLGYIGSRLVGEYFFSLLHKSPNSILNNNFQLQVGQFGCVNANEYLYTDFFSYAFNLPLRDPNGPALPTADNNNLHLDLI